MCVTLSAAQVENYFSLWCTPVDSIKLKLKKTRVKNSQAANVYV